MKLNWDVVADHRFELGVSNGVLYPNEEDGTSGDGVAWSGLTSVTQSPSGAEATPTYADNKVYVTLRSAETFGATIECLMYPDEFEACLGVAELAPGIKASGQLRRGFGFAYTNIVGNAANPEAGEKINLIYGASAAPSEKAHNTVNDSPELSTLSYELATTPVATIEGFKATGLITLDSRDFTVDQWSDLKDVLYGTDSDAPSLPTPAELVEILGLSGQTVVNMADDDNQPTYNDTSHVVTLPAVTGVQWKINGVNKANGAQPALGVGAVANIKATPANATYDIEGDDTFTFSY